MALGARCSRSGRSRFLPNNAILTVQYVNYTGAAFLLATEALRCGPVRPLGRWCRAVAVAACVPSAAWDAALPARRRALHFI